MRLDKLLSHSNYGSRKQVKELIRKGYVLVNGEVVTNDDYKINELEDEVIVDGSNIEYESLRYIMLNKPSGVVSATYDNVHETVIDLMPEYKKQSIFPVGRLDIDTEGLLLITNDGKLAYNLLSPKKHVDKKYYVEFSGEFKTSYIDRFDKGIELEDGYVTLPSKVELISNNTCYITIHEGKFHQVKRMFIALDMNVEYLKRVSFGSLVLDDKLDLGEFRFLTEEELKLLS
ncbi:MAG: pseudouridine synthase [Anaeroplasmataceae bacterium]